MDVCDLTYFSFEVKGIKFYQLRGRRLPFNTSVSFVREPSNPHDANAVLVIAVLSGDRVVLGHVAAQAVRWLNLLMGSYQIAG